MCVCLYRCIYTHMYVYIYMCVCMYDVCMYVCMYVFMYVCMYVHTNICVYMGVYMFIYLWPYIYIYVCTYIHVNNKIMCVYIYIGWMFSMLRRLFEFAQKRSWILEKIQGQHGAAISTKADQYKGLLSCQCSPRPLLIDLQDHLHLPAILRPWATDLWTSARFWGALDVPVCIMPGLSLASST